MDVLELPRPVINFLRTMAKEMNRYSLCWDIYGGSESVTLTLTWKINEMLTDTQQHSPNTFDHILSNQMHHQLHSTLPSTTTTNTTTTTTATPFSLSPKTSSSNLKYSNQRLNSSDNLTPTSKNTKNKPLQQHSERDHSFDSSQKQTNTNDTVKNEFEKSRKSRKQLTFDSNVEINEISESKSNYNSNNDIVNNRGKSLENLNNLNKKVSKNNNFNDGKRNFLVNETTNNVNSTQAVSSSSSSSSSATTSSSSSSSSTSSTISNQYTDVASAKQQIIHQQCPPPSLAYIKRKSFNQQTSSKQSTPQPQQTNFKIFNPWIKRDNCDNNEDEYSSNFNDDIQSNSTSNNSSTRTLTAVVTKTDANNDENDNNNNNNNSNNERKLSLQSTDSFSLPSSPQQHNLSNSSNSKVKFDPNLHYI